MTIHIPRPLLIVLAVVFGGGALALFLQELPDLVRYLKQVEGL
ncbi:MAG TPA: hypothetical protein VE992_00395 [Solirubrobacteraceae bacterium]|nr:hypothetical protein [Solirubrobacteraceae bacterium]